MNATPAPWDTVSSPLGPLTLIGGPWGLRTLHYDGAAPALEPAARDPGALAGAARQIAEYLDGRRRAFDLELDLRGGPLDLRVWRELRLIPYGATVAYRALAEAVGRPDAVRAVAGAVARTPVPIVVPCHRVIGSDGALRGYVGGLGRKAALLELERPAGGAAAAPMPATAQLELM